MAGILDNWTPEQWKQASDFMNSGQSAQNIWDTAQSVGLSPLELNQVYSKTVGTLTPDVMNQQIMNNGQQVNYQDLVNQQALGILNAPSQAAPAPTPAPTPVQTPAPVYEPTPVQATPAAPSPTAHLPQAPANPAPTTSQIYGWNPMQAIQRYQQQRDPYAQITQNVSPYWNQAQNYSNWLSGGQNQNRFGGLSRFNMWNPQGSFGNSFGNYGSRGLLGMFSR